MINREPLAIRKDGDSLRDLLISMRVGGSYSSRPLSSLYAGLQARLEDLFGPEMYKYL